MALTAKDVADAASAAGVSPEDLCAASRVLLPVLERLANSRWFLLRWGMKALIAGLELWRAAQGCVDIPAMQKPQA